MAKTRVHELAKEFGVESKFVLEKLKEMGEFGTGSSTVEPPTMSPPCFVVAWYESYC